MQAYPLTKYNRIRLAEAFRMVPEVDISIDCVLEDQMGSVFVDSVDQPSVFMIEQDQFFCYFAGDLTSASAKIFLAEVSGGRLLMSGSEGWHNILPDIYGERLHPITRWQFSSDKLSLEYLKTLAEKNPNTEHIRAITAEIAGSDYRYLGIGAFDSAEDFVERGIGFCMMDGETIVGVAYSSLVSCHAIEVSIFVEEAYRQKGVATALGCQLLIACLERGLSPHWDAANEHSCLLATKLGYTDQSEYKAYFLKSAS